MKILVQRQIKSQFSTIGSLFIDGVFECFTLEPVDRGLTSAMTLPVIKDVKIPGKTAIPTGTYKVSRYASPSHHQTVPVLLNVPGFEYVEIHAGNFPKDTKACLLLGTSKAPDMVASSREAIAKFYPKVFAALDNGEEVTITYQ